jgi:hypothetical protein
VVVFLLLGVIWAAVLVPPWLQSRREARPIASIMSFRSQLWSLQRATPNYGLDTYAAYDDDSYDDLADDELADGSVGGGAQVHAFDAGQRVPPVASMAPGVIGAVVRSPADGAHARTTSVLSAAVMHRRALAYRRRRQILSVLLLLAAGGVAPAVLLGTQWIVAESVAAALLLAYVGLLVRWGRREVERVQKVRYLTPIRAPRPAVVIIGSGAAR